MSESKTKNVAPYMTGKKKDDASDEHNARKEKKCGPFGRCYMVAVATVLLSFMFVIVASFFQNEVRSITAGLSSIFVEEELVEVAEVTADDTFNTNETTADNVFQQVELEIQQPKVNIPVASYPYQSVYGYSTNSRIYDGRLDQQRAIQDEIRHMQQVQMAELRELRTAAFNGINQDRADRLKKREELRIRTQQMQIEMQQKILQAYNDFHSI